MSILSQLRALPEGIHRLVVSLQVVAKVLQEAVDYARQNGPLEARLEELERSRAFWEATIEAELQKASSSYKSAANAESRARTMENHAAKLTDPFDDPSEEIQEGIPPQHAFAGEGEGVHDVRVDVAPLNSKALARRMKYL